MNIFLTTRMIWLLSWVALLHVPGIGQHYDGFVRIDSVSQKVPQQLLNRISVAFDSVTLENALVAISRQGKFKLNFNRSRIPANRRISIRMQDTTALVILLDVLKKTDTELLIGKDGRLVIVPANRAGKPRSKITGRVLDADSKEPLWGANISVLNSLNGSASGTDGRFRIENIAAGRHRLQFSYIGYETQVRECIVPAAGATSGLMVAMVPQAVPLSAVTVTPGQFSIMGKGPTVTQVLTRTDLEITPLGEDIYRAVTRLPGISASDFSAKFTVRGGENDEILVLLDGMELYEPFHLKDIDGGALSIIDVAAIEGVDLLTGGFPAEYGDRKSGVLNLKSTDDRAGRKLSSVGLSFMNARVMSQGSFDRDKGSWLFSARRGYLDLVMSIMKEQDPPRPVYYDLLNKIEYRLNGKHALSAHFLHSGDRLDYVEDDDDEDRTGYGNSYAWLTSKFIPNPWLHIRTLASYGRLTHERNGVGYEGGTGALAFTVSDDRTVDFAGLKQDWSLDLSQSWLMKVGFEYKNFRTRYDYESTVYGIQPLADSANTTSQTTIRSKLTRSGTRLGIYLSNRMQLMSRLTSELGLRYDAHSYTGDKHVSPRLNLAYRLARQTFIRGGWGYFYQGQGIHGIKVEDGETGFHSAELARHWVAGFEHTFRNGLNIRVEGYHKAYSNLRPDYGNLTNTMEVFPEVQYDRLSLNLRGASSKGIETYVKYDRGGKLTWWASYALARAEGNLHSLLFQGTEYRPDGNDNFPGRYDQRHSLYLDLNYRPDQKWHLNATWQFHSGWPYTKSTAESRPLPDGSRQYYQVFGALNGSNYPSYHRLDFTANRYFYTAHGRISAYLSLINLYNNANVRNIRYEWQLSGATNEPFLLDLEEHWFKLLPSIGLSWSWEH